jgi:hypothetical protein
MSDGDTSIRFRVLRPPEPEITAMPVWATCRNAAAQRKHRGKQKVKRENRRSY